MIFIFLKSSQSSQKTPNAGKRPFFPTTKNLTCTKSGGEYLVLSGVENYFFKSRILSLIKKKPTARWHSEVCFARALSLPLSLSLQSGHFQFTLADMLEKCFALVTLSSRGLGIFNLTCSAVLPWFRFSTFFRISYLYRVSYFQTRGFSSFFDRMRDFPHRICSEGNGT